MADRDDTKPFSSLDGYTLIGIDVDPDERLLATLFSLRVNGVEVVSVIPQYFHGRTRGYLVVSYDATKDPRATP